MLTDSAFERGTAFERAVAFERGAAFDRGEDGLDDSVRDAVHPADPSTLPDPQGPGGDTFRVTWSRYDQSYLACCDEWPGLSVLALSWEAALRGIRCKVEEARVSAAA